MASPVLIDAGPVVAVINRLDQWHEWSKREFARATASFVTCEAVLSEAFHLLEGQDRGTAALLDMLDREIVTCDFAFARNRKQVAALIRKYIDLPMSLADACLVRMAELHPGAKVFTTDEDFRIYRKSDRRVIPLMLRLDDGPYGRHSVLRRCTGSIRAARRAEGAIPASVRARPLLEDGRATHL